MGRSGDSLGAQLVRSPQFTDLLAHLNHGRPVSMSPLFTALATAKASTSGVYLSGLPLSASPSMVLWGQLQLVVSAAMAAGAAASSPAAGARSIAGDAADRYLGLE